MKLAKQARDALCLMLAREGMGASDHVAQAVDPNLFVWTGFSPGHWQYVTSTAQHRPLGEAWENLGPLNRWGGRFRDGNHYERLTAPWRD